MQLAFITDEISQDVSTALEIGTKWGICCYELRGIYLQRLPEISDNIMSLIEQYIQEYKVNILAISPGAFKVSLDSEKLDYHRGSLLEKSFRLAKRLSVDKVIIFGVKKTPENSEKDYEKVIKVLSEAADKAKDFGLKLAVENEPGFWADTGTNTARIVKDVGMDNLGINWDPGNCLYTDERPFPEGYWKVKDNIMGIHLKDGLKEKRSYVYVPLGEGEVDWEGQLLALIKDRYKGTLTIETHFSPKVEGSKKCLDYLRQLNSRIKFLGYSLD